ncbi:MAG TPA: hypothetical protein VER03_14680 [Bryobacteraceae bacterium]|nr:hypothetical protein [Bryobacteraceae bacterium]
MATQKQIESARRNGAKSHGPATPEGKAKSSRNALKHGLAADPEILLATENDDNYDQLLEAYIDTYQPANGAEYDLVCQAVTASWRLRRIGRIEANLIEDQMDSNADSRELFDRPPVKNDATAEAIAFRSLANTGRALDLLLRYATTARRAFDAALQTLRDLQRERRKSELQNEPDSQQPRAKSMASRAVARTQTARSLTPIAIFPAPPETSVQAGLETGFSQDPDVKIKQ